MIIRYGGGNSGIKEYLEGGRKMDRHFARDEMDARIPIEGDLQLTQAVYDSIEDKGQERYLHITLSFNEPDVTPESISQVFQQYKKQLMSAYKDDEFNVYAEIHWPKIKESYNHTSGDMEARYPHVHVVIPKRNLLTGGLLNPVGMHEQSVKYLDAIQEKLNRDNGLSPPRDNPRVGTNHYESALAKYKDKEFKSKNGDIKRQIYQQVIDRDIRTWDSFTSLLQEYGEVRIRNEKSSSPYAAVKIPGDTKFTNLKANIFNRAHIEQRALLLEPITDAQVSQRLETWQQIQSREIKFISNASSKVKAHYKSLSLPERREYLAIQENNYEQRHRPRIISSPKSELPGLPTRNYESSNFEFTGRIAPERTRNLHELRTGTVDYFGSPERSSDRLFLQADEDDHLQYLSANGDPGLRRDLYTGSGGRVIKFDSNPHSSSLAALVAVENEKEAREKKLRKYSEIRKKLDPESFLAFVQTKYGVDPATHPISIAKDGSPRIKVGKFNYNFSDFLTKHIGLSWEETAQTLDYLYEKQVNGLTQKPKAKIAHINDWRKFRDEIFPDHVKTYDDLKNEIKRSNVITLKTINSNYYLKRKAITQDDTLTRSQKHYFRSVVILEKLQEIEKLRDATNERNRSKEKIKYPYSTLFYEFTTRNEDFDMKVLDSLKRKYLPESEDLESPNSIGSARPSTPENMPTGVEAAKRARLIAQLQQQERDKEPKLKMGDLRPQPLANGAVAFTHKEHGKQIFVNHPDRLELNRVTEPDEVAVSLTYAVERFGSPLEIKGTKEFQQQVIDVVAERNMDITFTDEKLNKALEAKRQELGLNPPKSNSIAVPDIELDKSLPRDEAIDKALLESKVAELREINQRPVDIAEAAVRRAVVQDLQERHEELTSGIINNKKIADIATQDIEAFKYLDGKPEQQNIALAMSEVVKNKDIGEQYSDAIKENGPSELTLTIDAARFIQNNPQHVVAVLPNLELDGVLKKFTTALEDAKKDLATKPVETASRIEERSIIYGDSLIYARVPELDGVKDVNERLKIIHSKGIETIKPEIAKEWAAVDVAEFKKIQNSSEREYAAIEMVNNSRVSKTYSDFLQEHEPELNADIKAIDAANDKLIDEKENLKSASYAPDKDFSLSDKERFAAEGAKEVANAAKVHLAALSAFNEERDSLHDHAAQLESHAYDKLSLVSADRARSLIMDEQRANLRDDPLLASTIKFHPQAHQDAVDARRYLSERQGPAFESTNAEFLEHKNLAAGPAVQQAPHIEKILAQSEVIEMNLRHEKMKIDRLSGADVAKADLAAFSNIKSQLEKNNIAISIDKMMVEDVNYKAHIESNAPDDLYLTIGAAHAHQTMEAAGPTPQQSNDMEM